MKNPPESFDSQSLRSYSLTQVRRFDRRRAARLELGIAFSLTIARLAMSIALVLLVLSSYAWWGSPTTPMRGLWKSAVVFWFVWLITIIVYRRLRADLLKLLPSNREKKFFFDSRSQVEVPKQKTGK